MAPAVKLLYLLQWRNEPITSKVPCARFYTSKPKDDNNVLIYKILTTNFT